MAKKPSKSSPPLPRLPLYLPALLLYVLIGVASFVSGSYLWGVHYLGYYPPVLRIVVLLLVGAAFVPVVTRAVYRGIARTASLFTGRRSVAIVASAVTSGALLLLFMRIRSATLLLGDGQLQASLWRQMATRADMNLARFIDFLKSDFHQTVAFGTNIYAFLLGRLALATGNSDPLGGPMFLFALTGALLILTTLIVLRSSRAPVELRIVVVAAALLSGAVQLFFGYFETYAMAVLFSVLYVFLAYRSLSRPGWSAIAWSGFVLLLALFSNLMSALFVPSFVVLLAAGTKRIPARAMRIAGFIVAAMTVLATIVIGVLPVSSKFMLPLIGTKGSYGILSVRHVVDIVNELALIVPMGTVFLGVAMATWLAGRTSRNEEVPVSNKPRDITRRAFDLLLLSPCALFLIAFHPDLGMASDWDLYVLPVVGVAAPGFNLMRRWLADAPARGALRELLVPAMAVSAAIVVPWVGVNASESRSVGRYIDVVANENTGNAYCFEILALYYGGKGDHTSAAAEWAEAYARGKNPRYLYNQAYQMAAAGDVKSQRDLLEQCIADHPTFEIARRTYADVLGRLGEFDELIHVTKQGIELHPDIPTYYCYLVVAYYVAGMPEEAAAAIQQCEAHHPQGALRSSVEKVRAELERKP